MTFLGAVEKWQVQKKAIQAAIRDVSEYARLLKNHPDNEKMREACARVDILAQKLGRDVKHDRRHVGEVEDALRAISEKDAVRRTWRKYLTALRLCVSECRDDRRLHKLADDLGRSFANDCGSPDSVGELLSDLCAMNNAKKKGGPSESWVTNEPLYKHKPRWKELRRVLIIYGWPT
jgi:uncharacterized membrane-anchored protein YjiN (DUF445 family)